MSKTNDLKIIEKHQDYYILLHRISGRKLIYRECFISPDHTTQYLEDINIRNKIDHQNLLRLFSFHNDSQNSLETIKIALIYEHWSKSFSSELDLRLKTQIHWTEQELLNTLEVLLWGLDCLHMNGLVHGNITKDSIIYSTDGFVKLADQFIEFKPYKRSSFQLKLDKNSYITPELLTNNKDIFPSKEDDIWQLGMIFLESCLLRSCMDLIDWENQKINFNKLNERIKEIEKLQSKILANIFKIMLNEAPKERLNIMKLLKENWPTASNTNNLAALKINNNNTTKGILKNSNTINISLKPTKKPIEKEPNTRNIFENSSMNKENAMQIVPMSPLPSKENSLNIVSMTENTLKTSSKNEKYQEILQMVENYKSPFQSTNSSRRNSDNKLEVNSVKSEEFVISDENEKILSEMPKTHNNLLISNNSMPLQTISISCHNKHLLNLEDIVEETEENIEDPYKEDDESYIKAQGKNYNTNDSLNKTMNNNDKLAELQSLFEKSRARTNEILAKGKSINIIDPKGKLSNVGVNGIIDTPKEPSNNLLAINVMKSERKNLLNVVIYKNQDKYEGDLSKNNNQRQGFGVYYKSNGQILYQGEWHNNVYQGTGILNNLEVEFSQESMDYANLNEIKNNWLKYEGEFLQGKKQGNGVLLFSNKEYFQGCFKNDKMHGFGCFHRKNGTLVFAEWKDSKMMRLL